MALDTQVALKATIDFDRFTFLPNDLIVLVDQNDNQIDVRQELRDDGVLVGTPIVNLSANTNYSVSVDFSKSYNAHEVFEGSHVNLVAWEFSTAVTVDLVGVGIPYRYVDDETPQTNSIELTFSAPVTYAQPASTLTIIESLYTGDGEVIPSTETVEWIVLGLDVQSQKLILGYDLERLWSFQISGAIEIFTVDGNFQTIEIDNLLVEQYWRRSSEYYFDSYNYPAQKLESVANDLAKIDCAEIY